jgi:hypothetical protein
VKCACQGVAIKVEAAVLRDGATYRRLNVDFLEWDDFRSDAGRDGRVVVETDAFMGTTGTGAACSVWLAVSEQASPASSAITANTSGPTFARRRGVFRMT